ncbi:phosphotransferase enzyme family protein [Thermogemmatispora sp.]|uniref:phosphotransferase enzyme family protein n=1 Tax=Thermogemmatispora sp. TaxID=1968838 RepID=UPI001DEEC055|nr:phosphotransferase [Thermogemmatispora sp.]MBX5448456.1 phosphotransferase [Thermogemmatispora sp.]
MEGFFSADSGGGRRGEWPGASSFDLEAIMEGFGVPSWQPLGPLLSPYSSEPLGVLLEIEGEPYLLRPRPEGPAGEDSEHCYRFQRFLRLAGLPVPALRQTPTGSYCLTLGEEHFELQQWLGGEDFASAGPQGLRWVEAAGRTLAQLHEASLRFPGPQHRWPSELQAGGLVQGWLNLARERAERCEVGALSAALQTWVEQWEAVLPAAMMTLGAAQGLLELHIHGDYQALHMRFSAEGVCSVSDFYASRWEKRILEVAAALFAFSALDWQPATGQTRPLVARGLEPERARAFLRGYGSLLPPEGQEAVCLAEALMLMVPILTINGPLEDFVFGEETALEQSQEQTEEMLERLAWASAWPGWLRRARRWLSELWEEAASG